MFSQNLAAGKVRIFGGSVKVFFLVFAFFTILIVLSIESLGVAYATNAFNLHRNLLFT